jgi:hypothetical protein
VRATIWAVWADRARSLLAVDRFAGMVAATVARPLLDVLEDSSPVDPWTQLMYGGSGVKRLGLEPLAVETSVYFARAVGTDFVKIGFTSGEPVDRVRALSTACPHTLALESWFAGTADDERSIHRALAPRRVRGEWFRLSQAEVASVAAWAWDEDPRFMGVCSRCDLVRAAPRDIADDEIAGYVTGACPCGRRGHA